jgi:ribonuclease VapC
MVLDTSAIVAILCGEAECGPLKEAIGRDRIRLMSVASALETSIVLESRFGEAGAGELDLIIQRLPIELRAVDRDQLEWARHAFRIYGAGRHRAKLNYGDCFSYALAKATGEPLLYVGDDFAETDVGNALEE